MAWTHPSADPRVASSFALFPEIIQCLVQGLEQSTWWQVCSYCYSGLGRITNDDISFWNISNENLGFRRAVCLFLDIVLSFNCALSSFATRNFRVASGRLYVYTCFVKFLSDFSNAQSHTWECTKLRAGLSRYAIVQGLGPSHHMLQLILFTCDSWNGVIWHLHVRFTALAIASFFDFCSLVSLLLNLASGGFSVWQRTSQQQHPWLEWWWMVLFRGLCAQRGVLASFWEMSVLKIRTRVEGQQHIEHCAKECYDTLVLNLG